MLSFILPFPYDPSLLRLFSDSTPHSSHPARAMPVCHHHELRGLLNQVSPRVSPPCCICSCGFRHQSLDAESIWEANASSCLTMNLGTLLSFMSCFSGQNVGWLRKGPAPPPLGMTKKLGFYPAWDAKPCFPASDSDEPFKLWIQVMLLVFQENLEK